MKAMISSDLITMKNSYAQLAIVSLIVAVAIAILSGSLVAGVAAVAITLPFMFVLSISAYDELNGWEQFRLTLPISRRQVAYGRYASTLIVTAICDGAAIVFSAIFLAITTLLGSGLPEGTIPTGLTLEGNMPQLIASVIVVGTLVVLLTASISMPAITRFGLTKGTRLLPVIIVLLLAGGIWLLDSSMVQSVFPALEESLEALWSPEGALGLAVGGALLTAALVMYALSALLAARLYEKREL